MDMSDDNTNELNQEVRRYQWHRGYQRGDEYDDTPKWALDIEEEDTDDGTKFYDKFNEDDAWIESDTTRDLTRMI